MTTVDPVSVNLRLPRTLIERLDRQAKRRVLGRGRMIELVLDNWLEDVEADDA